MQATYTATIIENQPNYNDFIQLLDRTVVHHNLVERKLYADIIKFYKNNNTNSLPNSKINDLKSSYQTNYQINSRHYNSIKITLDAKIYSALELNDSNIQDTKDNIKSLEKTIKSKQSTLDNLIKKISAKDYIENPIDKINHDKLVSKLFYLNERLISANNKLNRFLEIKRTDNPHICFGSSKLFRQQFQVNSTNNQSGFKTHEDWHKAWVESRNKTFCLVGSLGETAGNANSQIKHIENHIYELKININPNPQAKLKDRFTTIKIKIHNDKNNLILNTINNNLGKDKSKYQALSFRFYKNHKDNTYNVFISLDKSKQQPKIISSRLEGSIGIDINADHLAVSEVDRFGNLIKSFDIELNLKDKTTYQSLDIIACAIKQITDYAVKVAKPIVIEKLDFSNKKKALKDSYNKKYNVMLSSFAYRKIIELIKSRSFDKAIEVIEVNPAYTSKIGKFKYQNQYKLTTHQAAALVIARRGLLSYTKWINKSTEIKDKDKKVIGVKIERKPIIVINKEKTISIRRSKYYPFGLPARNNQKQDNTYWKEIEQNYLKAKKHRIDLKRKKLILGNNSSKLSPCEITLVADNFGVDRDSTTNLLFMPF